MAMKLRKTRKSTRASEKGRQTSPKTEVTTRAEETTKDSKPKQGACIERSREDPQKGREDTRKIRGDETRTIGGGGKEMIGGDDTQTRGGDDTRTRGDDKTRVSRNENEGGEDDERIDSNPV